MRPAGPSTRSTTTAPRRRSRSPAQRALFERQGSRPSTTRSSRDDQGGAAGTLLAAAMPGPPRAARTTLIGPRPPNAGPPSGRRPRASSTGPSATQLKDTEVEQAQGRTCPLRWGRPRRPGGGRSRRRSSRRSSWPTSSYSQELTDAGPGRSGRAVARMWSSTTSRTRRSSRRARRSRDRDLEAIEQFGLTDARPDVARLGGWFLLAILVVGILLGWIWRFRRTLWHRDERARPDRADRGRDDAPPEAHRRPAGLPSSSRPRPRGCS